MAKQVASNNELGAAYYSLGADVAPLEAGLERGKQLAQSYANQTAEQLARADVSIGEHAKRWRGLVGSITSTIGSFGALAGAAGAVIGALAGIGRAFDSFEEAADRAQGAAGRFGEALQKFRETTGLEPVSELEAQLRRNREEFDRLIEVIQTGGDSFAERQRQYAEAEQAYRDAVRKAHEDDQKRREEAAKKVAEAEQKERDELFRRALDQAEQLEIQQLDGIERVNANERRALRELDQLRQRARTEEEQSVVRRLEAAIRDSASLERKRIQDREAAEDEARREREAAEEEARRERERKEREAAQRIAQSYADAIRNAAQSILSQQQSFFNSQFERMAADISVVRRLIESRGSWRP